MGWEGDVLNKNVNRLKVDAAQAAKSGLLGLIGVATGGLLGKQPEGQQPVADRNGVLPRAATTGAEASKQANESLRRFGQQHGIGVPEQTGAAGFLGGLFDDFKRRILPSDGMINRLKNGAAAATVAASGVVAGGVALAQDGANAVTKAVSKPTADEIAQKVAKGELDGHKAQEMINAGLVQLPDVSTIKHQKPAPIEDKSFRVAAIDATAPVATAPEAVSKGINLSTLEPKVIPPTTVPNTPVIPTAVTPTTDFKVAAAPVDAAPQVKPSQTPVLDALIEATKDASRLETLTKARAFVSKPAEPGGMN